MLQLDDLLLHVLRDLRQHDIIVASMLVDAELAVESFIDLAAVFNLLILMLLAIELPGVVVEVSHLIKDVPLKLLLL